MFPIWNPMSILNTAKLALVLMIVHLELKAYGPAVDRQNLGHGSSSNSVLIVSFGAFGTTTFQPSAFYCRGSERTACWIGTVFWASCVEYDFFAVCSRLTSSDPALGKPRYKEPRGLLNRPESPQLPFKTPQLLSNRARRPFTCQAGNSLWAVGLNISAPLRSGSL